MARTLGLLESFELAERVGARALTFEEVLFMANAKKRKGCVLQASKLTPDEIRRVLELGRKCQSHKEE